MRQSATGRRQVEKRLTLVDTDADSRLGQTTTRQQLGHGLDVGGVLLDSGVDLAELELARLGVADGASQRVHENLALQVRRVRRGVLDLDERVLDHHVAHGLVRLQGTDAVARLVRLVVRRVERAEDEARVQDEDCAADLTEAERGLQSRVRKARTKQVDNLTMRPALIPAV